MAAWAPGGTNDRQDPTTQKMQEVCTDGIRDKNGWWFRLETANASSAGSERWGNGQRQEWVDGKDPVGTATDKPRHGSALCRNLTRAGPSVSNAFITVHTVQYNCFINQFSKQKLY